ncbi:hypothetical protein X975_09319, partial [Stegodyphus mimosarum]
MQPWTAHLAARQDFSPQLTPSARTRTALFSRKQTAKASATGSPALAFVTGCLSYKDVAAP